MPAMEVRFEGVSVTDQLAKDGRELIDVTGPDGPPIQVVVIQGGMESGAPSVLLRIDLPDGKSVVAETSARLFVSAGRMIKARYGDQIT